MNTNTINNYTAKFMLHLTPIVKRMGSFILFETKTSIRTFSTVLLLTRFNLIFTLFSPYFNPILLAKFFQNHLNSYNDIALLRIKEDIETLMKIPSGTSFKNNILILNSNEDIDKRDKMIFAGWGMMNTNEYFWR